MQFSSWRGLVWSILAWQCAASPFGLRAPALLNTFDERQINVGLFNPPPSADAFYIPPNGWQNETTGTVLKLRTNAYPSIYIGNAVNVYQVMFRTTNSLGGPTWSTTTVFIPATHARCSNLNPGACSHAMVTYALPYDSCSVDGTPSYLLQFGEPYGDMYDLLNAGYFVNAPDFEGYNSSYTSGVVSGAATLDSTIAALAIAPNFGFDTANQRVALYGYSGGSFAVQFAAEFASYYTPDLDIAGVVMGGNVPNLIAPETTTGFTGNALAGLGIAGIIGITSQHPPARAYLNSILKKTGPYNIVGWYNATTMTGTQLLTAYKGQSVGDYLIGGGAALNNSILIDMYDTDSLMAQHGVPKMPVFIYKAINDGQASAYALDPYVDYFCDNGANILYHRNSIGGHNNELFTGRLRALDYLSDVLDGTNRISKPASGCRTVNVTRAVNITLVNTVAREGALRYPYRAVVLQNIDVQRAGWTIYPNGSYRIPGRSGIVNPNKRSEPIYIEEDPALIAERLAEPEPMPQNPPMGGWLYSIVTTILNEVRVPLSFLLQREHRLDTVADSPFWSQRSLGPV